MAILEPGPACELQVDNRLPLHAPARTRPFPSKLAPGRFGSLSGSQCVGTVAGAEEPQPNAFTLVELLVAIAIIAVLATLGIGAVDSAIERSRESGCANNLRTLASGVFAYAADNNGMVPPNNLYQGAKNTPWATLLSTYVSGPTNGFQGSKSVYFCPCGEHPRGWNNTLPDYACNARGGANQKLTGAFTIGASQSNPPTRMTEIQRPSKMMMFADSFQNNDINIGSPNAFTHTLSTATYFGKPELPERGLAPRHFHKSNPVQGRFNMVFFDGHVESFEWNDPRLQDRNFLLDLVRRY